MFQGGFVSWFLFYSFLPFAIYCLALSFYPLNDLKVTRVLRIGDPLGLFEKEKTFAADGKIIVYPAFSELIYRPVENQYDQGLTASRERVQRDTSMAVGIRNYQPGDRISWINWKASAKRNEIMTKEFEQRQSNDVFVVMDCVPNKHFESIVSFTASLLRAVLKKGAQTGLLTISKERVSFPIRGGEQHLHQLFYHLAKIEAKSFSPIEKVLEIDGLFIQQTVSFMFITAQITKPLVEKASFLGIRKGSITVFLIKGEKEAPTDKERSLIALANLRGVRIVLINRGNFAVAFSEV